MPTVPCWLAIADRAVRIAIFQIWGDSHDVQTLDELNCAKRKLSLPAEFWGLNVPSLELDVSPPHYASFIATLANVMIDYESESLGPMYGLIRQELLHIATSIFSVGGPIAHFVCYDLHYGRVFGVRSRGGD
jgi:hypothetical protein